MMRRNLLITQSIVCVAISMLVACDQNSIVADGYGNFEATETMVSSQANGQLYDFNLEEGEQLTKNQQIGFVDTIQLHLQKKQLQAQMDGIRAQSSSVLSQIEVIKERIKTLEVEKARVEQLLKDQAATGKQLDDIVGQINIQRQQINSIERQNLSVISQYKNLDSQMDQVENMIHKSLIISPINGVILSKYSENGEVVSFGKPLFKIADLKEMELRAYLSEAQLASVKLGQSVQVAIDQGEAMKYYDGQLSWISSSAEFTPKTIQTREERVNLVYAVKIKVKNDGGIKIGMPGELFLTNNNQ